MGQERIEEKFLLTALMRENSETVYVNYTINGEKPRRWKTNIKSSEIAMYAILQNSRLVHSKIAELFTEQTQNQRRVIIVAFVGAEAPSLLPNVKNVDLYCWPKAGSTNPHALYKLLKSGTRVHFVDNLHMKLYWVENKGAVITSANLSLNGLGEKGLHEIGVYFENLLDLNIDDIIKSLNSRLLTSKELLKLHREHDLYWSKNKERKVNAPIKKPEALQFIDWYQKGKYKNPWKFGWWQSSCKKAAKATIARAKRDYGVNDVADFINCKSKQYCNEDWLLCFRVSSKGRKLSDLEWMLVNFVEEVSEDEPTYKEDYQNYPFQAVQATKRSKHLIEPFRLDAKFKRAFQAAIKQYGISRIMDSDDLSPTDEFLENLFDQFIPLHRKV